MEKRLIDINPIIGDLTAMKSMYDAIALDGMIKALEEAPAVDAAPVVSGQWVGSGDGYADGDLYTICGRVQSAVMMLTVRTKNHNGDSSPAAARRWMEAMTYA